MFRCLLLLLLTVGGEAVQFVPMSIEDMTRNAELIVRGKVLDKSVAQDNEGRIYTRVRLEVLETWKGKTAAGPIEIVHSGGQLGGRAAITNGQVEYMPGEEVVAFLVLNARSQAVTLGLAQGKFHVWLDPETRQPMARNLFHGNGNTKAGGYSTSASAGATAATPGVADKLTVSTLKQLVQGGVK